MKYYNMVIPDTIYYKTPYNIYIFIEQNAYKI